MTDLKQKIEAANQKTMEIILSGSPMLVDVAPAREVVPGMTDNMILHSAPAIAWEDMCGPHKVGVIGAALCGPAALVAGCFLLGPELSNFSTSATAVLRAKILLAVAVRRC